MNEPRNRAQVSVEPRWYLASIQMTNWGGYHGGGHVMHFSKGNSLISGAPGTGKSTMLDAYLAVMMPVRRLRFNEASNDSGGNVRDESKGQRSILTYMRGKTGEVRGVGSDERVSQTLRGYRCPVWSAIAVNFENDHQQQFSAIKLFFASSDAISDTDVTKIGLTADHHVDTDQFDTLAHNTGFIRGEVSARIAAEWFTQAPAFEAVVQSRLGLDAGGSGVEALTLLSRIQAGKAMDRSVDHMFKELVLDVPDTFACADDAVAAFSGTEAAYYEMIEAGDKHDCLAPLPGWYRQYSELGSRIYLLEALGTTRLTGRDSAFARWADSKELALLGDAIDANRDSADILTDKQSTVTAQVEQLSTRQAELLARKALVGGNIAVLEETVNNRAVQVTNTRNDRSLFLGRIALLDIPVETEEEFTELRSKAHRFLRDATNVSTRLSANRLPPLDAKSDAQRRIREYEEEERLLSSGRGRMEPSLLTARNAILDATNLAAEDLPFVGELIDIKAEHSAWRAAAETTLHAAARELLVDNTYLDTFSRIVDGLDMRRIEFRGVTLNAPGHHNPQPGHISEVLDFDDDSPFIGWVRDRVSRPGADHRRVESPDELGGPGPRVTRAGQIRNGQRGSAGTATMRQVIGFSNTGRLDELQELRSVAEADAARAEADITATGDALDRHERLARAYEDVHDQQWNRIDLITAERGLADAQRRLDDELAGNVEMQQIAEELDVVTAAYKTAVATQSTHAQTLLTLQQDFDALTAREGNLADHDREPIAAEQATELNRLYENRYVGTAYSISEYAVIINGVRKDVSDELLVCQRDRDSIEGRLTDRFVTYNKRFGSDPNRGVGIESYPLYLTMLEQVAADEVYRLTGVWKSRMDEQAGAKLIQLRQAYESSYDRISERLEPIRDILAALSFGRHSHRLLLVDDRRVPADVADLFRRIDALTKDLARERTDEEYTQRYAQLRAVIDLIRKPENGTTGTARRNRLLNANDHIKITAAEYSDATYTQEVKHHDHLAALSGGEWQQLVAFVAAAGLRYRLGDAGNNYPRFAPVILDEGFIKANGEFALRGVEAWSSLGFQLIIAAPQDKVTGVEKAMDLMRCITKNEHDFSFISEYRR